MNELALFAGAGGGLLGTHFLGITPVCAIERNEHCRFVLAQRQNEGNLPAFPIWDDVRTFAGERWRGSVDIVSGGFPCQSFSRAARGRNTAKDLWPDMRRIITQVKPTYVFAENFCGAAIECAARDCAKMGYKAEMLSLSARDLGADHKRSRFWLLAYADDKSELRSHIDAEMAGMSEFCGGVWEAGPNCSRMADGLAGRMERYTATGNGQVPIVAAAALWALAQDD